MSNVIAFPIKGDDLHLTETDRRFCELLVRRAAMMGKPSNMEEAASALRQAIAEMKNPAGSSEGRDTLNTEARAELIKLGEMLTAKVAIRKAREEGKPT